MGKMLCHEYMPQNYISMGKRDIGHFHGKVAILVTPMGKPDIGHGNLRTLVVESIFVNNLLGVYIYKTKNQEFQQSYSSSFLFPLFLLKSRSTIVRITTIVSTDDV